MTSNLAKLRAPILPDRVRRIAGQGFAFIPHTFLADGFLSLLQPDQVVLYLFLVLTANRDGVSFYGYDKICSILNFHLDQFLHARNALINLDLIAFDGTRFQVLSLPPTPIKDDPPPSKNAPNLDDWDPATIRSLALKSLGQKTQS